MQAAGLLPRQRRGSYLIFFFLSDKPNISLIADEKLQSTGVVFFLLSLFYNMQPLFEHSYINAASLMRMLSDYRSYSDSS